MKRNDVDRSKLSPMMKHYVELKDKYEDVIILYRLGDFYEMFFEDAEVVAHALELYSYWQECWIRRESSYVWNTTSCC